jgi:hypothetical protein
MRGVGAAAAAVASCEFGRFVAHGDADGAGGHRRRGLVVIGVASLVLIAAA